MNTSTMISRLLMTLMVATASFLGFAQDSYREALKENLSINGNFDKLKVKDVFIKISDDLFVESDHVEQLTERYIK